MAEPHATPGVFEEPDMALLKAIEHLDKPQMRRQLEPYLPLFFGKVSRLRDLMDIESDYIKNVIGVIQQLIIDTDESLDRELQYFPTPLHDDEFAEEIRGVARILIKMIALVESIYEYLELENRPSVREIEEMLFGGTFAIMHPCYCPYWFMVHRPKRSHDWFRIGRKEISRILNVEETSRPFHFKELSSMSIDEGDRILRIRPNPLDLNNGYSRAGWNWMIQRYQQMM